ncbi:hypothetical protein CASFOL_012246 [Castilleja foliolosa]|uniref:Protein kinase domain-containing protein n=1 Tax=Castilleja foliolosa TaxID=1961234 RepID=A0ABD3DTI3_9LAMI
MDLELGEINRGDNLKDSEAAIAIGEGLYKTIERIERGGYGVFYKCLDLQTNEYVVKKMIPYESNDAGVPYAVLNEISVLMELNHENIVRMNWNHTLLKWSFLFQILQGVSYYHAQKVMHGDLKPKNLLVDTKSKTVKLFGFGLTMTLDVPLPQYTTKVGTVSYQAPEILFGTPYSRAVDIWSVGCIFAEMVGKNVLFEGLIDTITMSKIISVVGLPDEEDWPGVTEALLKFYGTELPDFPPPLRLSMVIPGLDPQGLDLLTDYQAMVAQLEHQFRLGKLSVQGLWFYCQPMMGYLIE